MTEKPRPHHNPTRRRLLALLGGAGLVGAATWLRDERRIYRMRGQALGTEVTLTAWHKDREESDHALREAFAELDRVESILSLYCPESQLCQLNQGGHLARAHPYLLGVLQLARVVSQQSNGAFDVTIQPLWLAHDQARQEGRELSSERLAIARDNVDWRQIRIEGQAVHLDMPGMALSLNGIAQGFAVDRVRDVLQQQGITHALIDTGEFGSLGHGPTSKPWRVGIEDPSSLGVLAEEVTLDGRCLATSGNLPQLKERGRNHILDPRSGNPVHRWASVSVIADSAMLADALSTALSVLDREEGEQLLLAFSGAEAIWQS